MDIKELKIRIALWNLNTRLEDLTWSMNRLKQAAWDARTQLLRFVQEYNRSKHDM